MIYPTWQDYYVSLGTDTSKAFTIKDGGTTIYAGTIYSKSVNQEALSVNIMPVVRDYLSAVYPLPNMSNGTAYITQPTYKTFSVTPYGGSAVNVEVYYDYSYQVLYSGGIRTDNASYFRNDPIIARFSPSQGLFFSHVKTKSFSYKKIRSNGTNTTRTRTSTGCASAWGGQADELWSQFVAVESADFVTPEGRSVFRFDIVPDCYRWALDYLNAWGGWDSLLIEGTWREIDGYERGQYRTGDGLVTDSNVYVRNRRDKTDYLNTITKRFELNTALLTDDEASRMHHLLGSTNVYLRDLTLAEEYCSWAANIIDSECEYKKHDGGTWAQYRIQVEISQQLTRQG